MIVPTTLDTAQALIAFMIQVWTPIDWEAYERWHDAAQTALAFGWVPTEIITRDEATIYTRGFDRVLIDNDGAGIAPLPT